MSYEALEIGAVGQPVEMFFFQQRALCWPYTSSDRVQNYGGRDYNPHTISRGAFERNDEAGSSTVTVRIDRNLKVATQFLEGSTPTPVNLTIYRKHRADGEVIVLFKGVVANAERIGEELILTCVSPLSADEKAVPRELIMRTCPHVLYGERCQINPENWEGSGTITAISGTQYTVGSMTIQSNDFYTAGVLFKPSTGQRAFVQDHWYSGGTHKFVLLRPVPGWATTDAVTAYAGCDRKHTTCRDKFSNIANFGGFPLHPERNPFITLKVGDD